MPKRAAAAARPPCPIHGRSCTQFCAARQVQPRQLPLSVRTSDERGPHKTTRALVERDGHPMIAALYRHFDEVNAWHFGGKLASPLILVSQTSSPRALGDACERDVHGLRSIVRIAPKTLDKGERFAFDVLLHEMVHVWQYEVAGDTEPGYRGHGPRFAEQCNAIADAAKLQGHVGVKGRKGLPDCAQWPLCVRPAGYYGDEAAEREREKRAPKTKAERDGDAGDAAEARAELSRAGAAAVCESAADEAEDNGDPPSIARTLRAAAAYLRNVG